MPSLAVADTAASLTVDAVVVGLRPGANGPRLADGAAPVDAALDGRLLAGLRALGARGRAGEVHRLATLGLAGFPLVVGVGLSEPGSAQSDAEAARRAAGAAVRTLTGSRRVHIAIDADPGALGEGALLGAYAFTAYKSSATKPALSRITVGAADPKAARAALKRAAVVAEAVTLTRDLVNTPANDLYPETFANRARELAEARGLTVEVLTEKTLERKGYGGIIGVGKGSARPPRLVRIEYAPAKARTHLALVGKGITFDTGGYNLKTGAGLSWMKSDMGGAAAMLASILAMADLKLPIRVTATLPMAENMISGSSYRPSDVLTLFDGTTVEIGDTDAEGRLILADAISRAMQDGPDRLIEISTLTGAQVTALGHRVIGAMGEDGWRDQVAAAGSAVGEPVWSMPMPEELRGLIDSPVADLVNVPDERVAGMLLAGRFLGEFVAEDVPWVHLDIAGPSWNKGGPRDYTPRGGTGAGVRTVIAAAESLV